MNPIKKAIEENRIIFFPNGKYKYIPTNQALKKIEEAKKPFNSEKANTIHEVKLMYRKNLHQETDRRLAKIEKYIDKGLIRISNKEFICQ